MSNDTTYARLFKQWASVSKLVLDGKRDPQAVSEILQGIISEPRTEEPKPKVSIFEPISTIVVSATTDKFVAKEKFVINVKRNAPVRISYLGDNFKAWFLNGDGKTEDPITEQTLRYVKLRQPSLDGHIIEELGREAKAETTLSETFSLMEKQKYGEDGVLLNNGWANLFYIKDSTGVLRAVHVIWCGIGWRVGAGSVESQGWWSDGYRVFSRVFKIS